MNFKMLSAKWQPFCLCHFCLGWRILVRRKCAGLTAPWSRCPLLLSGTLDCYTISSWWSQAQLVRHDGLIKWKHVPRYWPFVRGIHRCLVNSPHKGQWLGALVLSLICALTNGWVNNRDAGDLMRHRAHYDVTVMDMTGEQCWWSLSGSVL